MNRLAGQRSAYLQHAAHQPVDWHPWSDDAFELARREDKPVFVSTGAVWCHWCHVMAKESFEDPETARILNERFVCIKLDRDERPDIDRRLQQAVAAMGGGSGWPLSVFLTPDRQAFYGGTYFPPDDGRGRPGFRRVLSAVADHYASRRQDALSYGAQVRDALQQEPGSPEELSEGLLLEAEERMLSVIDAEHGGFGTAPKFPMPGALEFLLRRARDGSREAREAAHRMLLAMADGGFHDQVGGGFHRYSVDEAWIVPHFEKMTDDNAGLLRNYAEGSAVLGNSFFLAAADDIASFSRSVLVDPDGGFYASQDADVTPDDEGGYFTWSDAELRQVLDAREYALIASHLVHPRGNMHHDPRKHVLCMHEPAAVVAKRMGIGMPVFEQVLRGAREKLLARRQTRTPPTVDTALYPSLNGMMSSSFFRFSLVRRDPVVVRTAIAALERIMQERWQGDRLWHADAVPGLLEDHIHLIDALLSGYEATGRPDLLQKADALMRICCERFLDTAEGGFFDTEHEVLGSRLKRIEDIPHPSANAVAILALLKLAFLTGREEYRREAERALMLFAGTARQMGVHAGSYFCALHAYYRSQTLTIEAPPDSVLAGEARAAALRSYAMLSYGADNGRLISCVNGVCSPPVQSAADLPETFQQRRIP